MVNYVVKLTKIWNFSFVDILKTFLAFVFAYSESLQIINYYNVNKNETFYTKINFLKLFSVAKIILI